MRIGRDFEACAVCQCRIGENSKRSNFKRQDVANGRERDIGPGGSVRR